MTLARRYAFVGLAIAALAPSVAPPVPARAATPTRSASRTEAAAIAPTDSIAARVKGATRRD